MESIGPTGDPAKELLEEPSEELPDAPPEEPPTDPADESREPFGPGSAASVRRICSYPVRLASSRRVRASATVAWAWT